MYLDCQLRFPLPSDRPGREIAVKRLTGAAFVLFVILACLAGTTATWPWPK
jgi:hypothetical protein